MPPSSPLFEQVWFNLTGRFKIAPDDVMNQKWYRALFAIYNDESHRLAHDTSWVVDTLWRIDEYSWESNPSISATEALELAVWFSHSVFNPAKDTFTNTLESARLAGECMVGLGMGDEVFRRKVVRFITSPRSSQAEYPQEYAVYNDSLYEWYGWSDEDHARRLHLMKQEWQDQGDHAFVDWRRETLNRFIRQGFVLMTERAKKSNDLAMERVNLELSIYNRVMPTVNA